MTRAIHTRFRAVATTAITAAVLAMTPFLPAPVAQAEPDPYRVTQVTTGDVNQVCMLGSDWAVDCFGASNSGPHLEAPGEDRPGPYTAVGGGDAMPGGQTTCALTPAGDVDCWGAGAPLFSRPGPYQTVSVGVGIACALTPAGAADCWDGPGAVEHYPGPFQSIDTGDAGFCAVTDARAVDCFGPGPTQEDPDASHRAGPFSSVIYGEVINGACATTLGGDVDCWSFLGDFEDYTIAGPLTGLVSGGINCALKPDGAIRCWDPFDGLPEFSPDHGPYTSVAVASSSEGYPVVCGLRAAGVPDCPSYPEWGDANRVGAPPYVTTFLREGPAPVVGQEFPAARRLLSYPTSVQVDYTVVSGSLPPGVSIGRDGHITGVPTAAGHFVAEILPSNIWGAAPSATTLTLHIDDDTDHDGIGNATDSDDDGDGLPDTVDPYPLAADGDGDGLRDNADNCRTTANPNQADLDGDHTGDACDPDIDGDGIPNATDAFPTNAAESADSDGDGLGDNTDNCRTTANASQADIDGDHTGDACDPDIDGDGIPNANDAFPTNAAETLDTDADGIGNNADLDDDGDGIADTQDGFPLQKDGALSGVLSKQIKANPALAPVLGPLRLVLLALGL